jgi:hypothetical protein
MLFNAAGTRPLPAVSVPKEKLTYLETSRNVSDRQCTVVVISL